MSHHIYTTKAFIVHSTSYGEAGKFLLLFTKDFGMIGAIAQGIRLSKSKLRYHTQDFSFTNVSLVKGKEVWRLTGAHGIDENNKPNILHIKILKLLRRLLYGEEKNEKLFEIVESLYKGNFDEEDYDDIECLIVLRVLDSLGYISNKEFNEFINEISITRDFINKIKLNKKNIISIINNSLRESQL